MPSHDLGPYRSSKARPRRMRDRAASRRLYDEIARRLGKRKDDGGEGVLVQPNRPNNLTGGAAAALEFDD